MLALYVLGLAAAGDRFFLPIANVQPLQTSETVYVPLNQVVPAAPPGYAVAQDRSVPMSWSAGAFLVGFGASVAALGISGSSRRAVLSAVLAVPLAAQAKPEDYVGGYTTKSYEKTYAEGAAKCFSSGATAPGLCAGPGGSPKDPLINPSYRQTITTSVDTPKPPAAKEEEKKK